ncbi:MAG: CPBP family intramembrane metalloprotease [Gammaproteobacteria bacterium]|nr:CPBP family intramembrane metalloprotease [Gammaproteobacteria bacterium]
MRWIIIWSVFRKEILNTLRDKKTLLINIGIPLLLWPILAVVMTQAVTVQMGKQEEKISKVAVTGDVPRSLQASLESEEKVRIATGTNVFTWDISLLKEEEQEENGDKETRSEPEKQRKKAEKLLQAKTVDAFFISSPLSQADDNPDNYEIWIVFDSTKSASNKAKERLDSLLSEWQKDTVAQRLDARGVSETYIKPLKIHRQNMASKKKQLHDAVSPLIPYMLITMLIVGCFFPAIEMTAGEKELGTLPTLLCAPVHYLELVLGKYFTVVLIALVGVLANMLSIVAVLAFGLGALQLNLSAGMIVVIFLILVPLALLFSAVSLAVAVFANTFKEGQNLLSPFMIVALLPALAAIIPDIELTAGMAMLPGFNVSLLIKKILVEPAGLGIIFITLLSNTLFSMLALIFTAKVFSSEPVLFGSSEGMFNRLFSQGRNAFPEPAPSLVLLVFVFIFIASFYVSGGLAGLGMHVQIPVLQLGIFLAIPLLTGIYFRWDLARAFRLSFPSAMALGAAALIGLSGWIAVSWTAQLITPPKEFIDSLVKALGILDEQYNIAVYVLLIAILPGICEEFAFRGFLLSGFLKRFSPPWAILLTSVCFGIAHMSVYRFLPTAVLGIFLGYAVWKTGSVWTGVFIHMLNNGSSLLAARYVSSIEGAEKLSESVFPLSWILSAALVCGLGLWLLHKDKGRFA